MPEKLNKQLSILNVLYVQNFEWFSFGWLQVMFLLLLTILKTTLSASKHLQLWIKALNCIKSFKVQNCSTGDRRCKNCQQTSSKNSLNFSWKKFHFLLHFLLTFGFTIFCPIFSRKYSSSLFSEWRTHQN